MKSFADDQPNKSKGVHSNAGIARTRLPKKITIQILAWQLGIAE
jgi:hypothetical protein